MKKKVFITGITGMVGSHLADYLLKNTNLEIHGLIRVRSPLDNIEHLIDKINKKKRIFLHYGDLRDSKSLNDIFKKIKPELIFHLAAQSFPLTSFYSPIDTYETNILGTSRLLETIKNFSPNSLIHVCSSSEIFGRVDKDKIPINEDCSFHPASPYAISKIGTDCIARFYFEAYNLKILVTRMFTHTGPRRGDVFSESTFAKQISMIEASLQEPKIYVGNLDSLRTYADVRDAVKAYYMLVTINPTSGEYYNIGGNYTCKIADMLYYLISQSTVKNIEIVTDPERLRPIDADLQVPDITKFQNHTGWKPEYTFEQTMNDLLQYWRDRVNSGRKFLRR